MGDEESATSTEKLLLILIHRSLENKDTRESTWAKPLGGDLYEIKGPLHLIADLNPKDVVSVRMFPGESIPTVSDVVERSGYKTLHLAFYGTVPLLDQNRMLNALEQWSATYQMAFEDYYTVEILPSGDFQAVCKYLQSLKMRRLLQYEPDIDIDSLLRFRLTNRR